MCFVLVLFFKGKGSRVMDEAPVSAIHESVVPSMTEEAEKQDSPGNHSGFDVVRDANASAKPATPRAVGQVDVEVDQRLRGNAASPVELSIHQVNPHGSARHFQVPAGASSAASPRLAEGTYELVLYETDTNPGMRWENVSVHPTRLGPEKVFEWQPCTVRVTVVDQDGKPVSGANVTVAKVEGGTLPDLYTYRRGLSDANGLYEATGLTDGLYNVGAEKGPEKSYAPELHMTPEQDFYEARVQLQLKGAEIRGRAVAPDGGAPPRIGIQLQGMTEEGMGLGKGAETLANGEFIFSNIPAGRYRIAAMERPEWCSTAVELELREELNVDGVDLIVFAPQHCGRVDLESSLAELALEGHADVRVTIRSHHIETGIQRFGMYDRESGEVRMQALPKGPNEISLVGFQAGENGEDVVVAVARNVMVEPGQVTEVTNFEKP